MHACMILWASGEGIVFVLSTTEDSFRCLKYVWASFVAQRGPNRHYPILVSSCVILPLRHVRNIDLLLSCAVVLGCVRRAIARRIFIPKICILFLIWKCFTCLI